MDTVISIVLFVVAISVIVFLTVKALREENK